MSRIYFHTPERTVELLGSERAYMHALVRGLALGILSPGPVDKEWLRGITEGAAYDVFAREGRWPSDFSTWFRVGDGGLRVGGEVVPPAELAANTVIDMRSPTLSLVARLEGMCEDHAWIDAEDAGWFADRIDEGRGSNIFRAGQGWEGVAELAREVASGLPGPIVTSYSVCESFPNSGVAEWEAPTCDACKGDGKPNERMKFRDADYDHCTTCGGDGVLHDAWYDLPEDERWRLAEAGMKARKYNRQISPDTQGVGFLSGASVFDLAAERWAASHA